MKMTRDEAEKLVRKLVTSVAANIEDTLHRNVNLSRDTLQCMEECITALTTDTEMYEGEPKEEWRKTEDKIEACMSSIKIRVYNHDNRHSWDHPTDYLINEIKEILTNHFGGGKT